MKISWIFISGGSFIYIKDVWWFSSFFSFLGKRFAQYEMVAVLSYIVSNYTIHTCEKTPMPLKYDPRSTLLLTPIGGVWVQFKKIAKPWEPRGKKITMLRLLGTVSKTTSCDNYIVLPMFLCRYVLLCMNIICCTSIFFMFYLLPFFNIIWTLNHGFCSLTREELIIPSTARVSSFSAVKLRIISYLEILML